MLYTGGGGKAAVQFEHQRPIADMLPSGLENHTESRSSSTSSQVTIVAEALHGKRSRDRHTPHRGGVC